MTIPSSRSLIFEVKSTGSELAFIRVLRLGFNNFAFGRLRTSSENFGRLRKSSDYFGNDRVVFKNPSTPRIKISRLYLRKSWQVYHYMHALASVRIMNSEANCVQPLLPWKYCKSHWCSSRSHIIVINNDFTKSFVSKELFIKRSKLSCKNSSANIRFS